MSTAMKKVNPRNGKYRLVYLGWKSATDQCVTQANPSVPNSTGENRPAATGETRATFLNLDATGPNFEVAHLQKKKNKAKPQKGYVAPTMKTNESIGT